MDSACPKASKVRSAPGRGRLDRQRGKGGPKHFERKASLRKPCADSVWIKTGRRFQWLCTYNPAEPLLTPYGCISLIIIEPQASCARRPRSRVIRWSQPARRVSNIGRQARRLGLQDDGREPASVGRYLENTSVLMWAGRGRSHVADHRTAWTMAAVLIGAAVGFFSVAR